MADGSEQGPTAQEGVRRLPFRLELGERLEAARTISTRGSWAVLLAARDLLVQRNGEQEHGIGDGRLTDEDYHELTTMVLIEEREERKAA